MKDIINLNSFINLNLLEQSEKECVEKLQDKFICKNDGYTDSLLYCLNDWKNNGKKNLFKLLETVRIVLIRKKQLYQ